ncbi:MAG TPA: scyllo-inosose 3-dehydrogenase [bacterium]|nr:scyllo-inosose 3-dehydrogenase [bacterium]
MNGAMRTLVLDAVWEPRPGYPISPQEKESRKAIRASAVWKSPSLQLTESPIPRIGDDEVLIRVKACGVCGSDIHCYETDAAGYVLFSGSAKLPVTLGHEYSGEVVEVGRNVGSLKVGDAVAAESMVWCGLCASCRAGNPNQCRRIEMVGFSFPGAFAEYIAVQEKYCWNLDPLREAFPSGEDAYEVGALIEPIGCAYNGIFISGGGFRPGSYVAVHGAGPIGLAAVLLARAAGAAKIFAFDPSEPRNALALALGADYAASPLALRRQGTSPGEIIRDSTGGHGADLQVEAAGAASATLPEIEKSLAPNGKVIYLGRHDAGAPFPLDTLVSQANQICGARGHSGYGIYPFVIRLLASGRFPARPMITARFPLEKAVEAVRRSTERTDGKIIVGLP